MRLAGDVSVFRADNCFLKTTVETARSFGLSDGSTFFVVTSRNMAGFHGPNRHHGPELGSVAERPLSTQWLSDERIAEARRVWSKAYGRVISDDEAIEILTNVRRLAEILLRAEEEKRSP